MTNAQTRAHAHTEQHTERRLYDSCTYTKSICLCQVFGLQPGKRVRRLEGPHEWTDPWEEDGLAGTKVQDEQRVEDEKGEAGNHWRGYLHANDFHFARDGLM